MFGDLFVSSRIRNEPATQAAYNENGFETNVKFKRINNKPNMIINSLNVFSVYDITMIGFHIITPNYLGIQAKQNTVPLDGTIGIGEQTCNIELEASGSISIFDQDTTLSSLVEIKLNGKYTKEYHQTPSFIVK